LFEIAVFFAANRSIPAHLTDRNPEYGEIEARWPSVRGGRARDIRWSGG